MFRATRLTLALALAILPAMCLAAVPVTAHTVVDPTACHARMIGTMGGDVLFDGRTPEGVGYAILTRGRAFLFTLDSSCAQVDLLPVAPWIAMLAVLEHGRRV